MPCAAPIRIEWPETPLLSRTLANLLADIQAPQIFRAVVLSETRMDTPLDHLVYTPPHMIAPPRKCSTWLIMILTRLKEPPMQSRIGHPDAEPLTPGMRREKALDWS